MVISHSKKFIFIHIYKVAGTSITSILDKYTQLNTIQKLKLKSGAFPYLKKSTYQDHIKASDLRKRLPIKIYNRYYKFAFVRNPWDWQVSLYHYALNLASHRQHKLIKGFKSFEEYLDWRVNDDLVLQKSFVYENEKRIVDFVGKYESLVDDFNIVRNRLDIDDNLPHLNKTKHNSYRNYYTAQSQNLIKEAFKEDIETFNYSF